MTNPIQLLADAVVAAAAAAAVLAVFPGSKRKSWCSIPIAIPPLSAAAAAAAIVLAPLVLLRHLPHRARPIVQRIGAKLSPFPGSEGYVDAPYGPEPTCGSETTKEEPAVTRSVSLPHLLGVGAVPLKSSAIPTPRIAPPKTRADGPLRLHQH